MYTVQERLQFAQHKRRLRDSWLTITGWAAHHSLRLLKSWKEIVTLLASVFGWLSITWGIYSLTATWEVWPISLGILVLGLVGLKLLGTVLWYGLYLLSNDDK